MQLKKSKVPKTSQTVRIGLLVLMMGSLIYTLYDNHRFIVTEQEIIISRLPASFDGFRILQISDLHGWYFGDKQADLIKAINNLDYDMIAFTGDMNDSSSPNDSAEQSKAILTLLNGISNRDFMFWVDGNTGPYALQTFHGALTGEMTEIGTMLEEKGVIGLTLPYAIMRGNDRIWITPEMNEITFDLHYRLPTGEEPIYGGKKNYAKTQTFYEKAYAAFQEIKGNGEVKILLSHTPKQTNLSEEEIRQFTGSELDYDLILAGHYHGGQLRLPFYGALYIPSPTTGINNSGLFPPQTDVKGISYYGRVPQFISAGLGASGHVRWAGFRLFNTPEINLLTLKRE